MDRLGVVGNISIDLSCRAGIRGPRNLGGAALNTALAAAHAGFCARPISVVGDDLDKIRHSHELSVLDLSGVRTITGNSATFTLHYDDNDVLQRCDADYGVSTQLTTHALEEISARRDDRLHVCCRRPLDIGRVAEFLAGATVPFSLDFFLPSAAESISTAEHALPMAQVVFVNAVEYDLMIRTVPARVLGDVIVTDGPGQVRLLHAGQCLASAAPPQVMAVDVTGSGDVLAGTFLAARAAGVHGQVALEWAVCAASAHAASPPALLFDD